MNRAQGNSFLPILLIFLLILSSLSVYAQTTQIQYLSGIDKDSRVTWEFKVNGGRNSGEWSTIPVPSNWEMEGFGSYRYWSDWGENPAPDSQGLYRYRFDVPANWAGKSIDIIFGGVMTDTQVRVNGKSAGPIHQGGFYQFHYTISDLLKFGDENLIEVEVNRFAANRSVNLAERRADFWLFSGIYRPVWLEAKPPQHIERVALDAKHTGDFVAQVFIDGISTKRKANRLTAQIRSLDGKAIGSPFSVELEPRQSQARLSASFTNIEPWSAENPQRYQVEIQLQHKDQTLHRVNQIFGFRTVNVRPGDGFYINGKKVRLKGANRHSFWPDSGRTTSRELSVKDVELMKAMNMNAVRMSHYPPDKHFLEVTDELGLYVINELTGWQDAYDTDVGAPLVKELVLRDINHPSVIIWANGNEGGWNTELDDDFHRWDIQQRPVIHPWGNFGGIDTAHYNEYNCCTGTLFHGKDLIMPTEFLHGLYDGGAAAGLDDWWRQMMANPLAIGGFIWAFADEGIVRDDKDGAIDVAGNSAPDGIVGPYREKEGSFFAIKEIWSPVYLPRAELDFLAKSFDGKLRVENRYDFTNLNQLTFTWQLVDFPLPLSKETGHTAMSTGIINPPDVAPGRIGELTLDLPADWQSRDALYLTATDPQGREIYTWTWMIAEPEAIAQQAVNSVSKKRAVSGKADGDLIRMKSGDLTVAIDSDTGYIAAIKKGSQTVSLGQGPRPVHGKAQLTEISHGKNGDDYVIKAKYEGALEKVEWSLRTDGWLKLTYAYQMSAGAKADYLGVTFDYPEEQVTGVRWLGKGPYRIWKNRTKGVEFDVWEKAHNDTITGLSWVYPEFKGFHGKVHWAVLENEELPVTMVIAADNTALRLFTPTQADSAGFKTGKTAVEFPDGDISFLQGIAPIGTKFTAAADHGPNGDRNTVPRLGHWYQTSLYFYFGGE